MLGQSLSPRSLPVEQFRDLRDLGMCRRGTVVEGSTGPLSFTEPSLIACFALNRPQIHLGCGSAAQVIASFQVNDRFREIEQDHLPEPPGPLM